MEPETITRDWMETLRAQVDAKNQKIVAAELGISKATLNLVLNGKYMAKTDAIQAKVEQAYVAGGPVPCPIVGTIPYSECTEYWSRMKRGGVTGGNPEVVRVLKACKTCKVRV